jgi:hypothetical protein
LTKSAREEEEKHVVYAPVLAPARVAAPGGATAVSLAALASRSRGAYGGRGETRLAASREETASAWSGEKRFGSPEARNLSARASVYAENKSVSLSEIVREEEAAARLRVSSLERNPNGGSLGKSGWFVPDAHRGSPSGGGLAGIVRDEEAKAAAAAAAAAAAREEETAAAAAAARTPAARRRKAGNKPPREPTKASTKERTKASTKEPLKEPTKEPLKEPVKEPVREPSKEPRRPNSRRGKKKNEEESSADSKPARSKHRRATRLATDATDAARLVRKKGPSEASSRRRETDANPAPIKPPRVVPRGSRGEEKEEKTVPTRDTFEG